MMESRVPKLFRACLSAAAKLPARKTAEALCCLRGFQWLSMLKRRVVKREKKKGVGKVHPSGPPVVWTPGRSEDPFQKVAPSSPTKDAYA